MFWLISKFDIIPEIVGIILDKIYTQANQLSVYFTFIPVYEHMAFWQVDLAPLAATACYSFPHRHVVTLGKFANEFCHAATLPSILVATLNGRVAGVILRCPGMNLTAGGYCYGETEPWPRHEVSASVFQLHHFPTKKRSWNTITTEGVHGVL